MDETKPDGIAAPPLPLRVLILEDDVHDAKLAAKALEGAGIRLQFEVTDLAEVFRANLEKFEYDVILADFNLRNWTALDALEILKQSGKDIPLIVVTGSLGDEAAAECIKRGAADFTLKDRPARLPVAVQRALEEKRLREERKRAEQELRESEERYRLLFERNMAGVFRTTIDGRVLECNQAMANILGFASPLKARDRRILDFYMSDHDRANFLERLKLEGGLTNFEMRLRREDGSTAWLLGNIGLTTSTAGGSQIIEGTLVDITERKLAEAENSRLAVIVNSSDDAIFSANREGLIITWNPGAERMYGYAVEEITGKHFFILIPEEHRAELAGIEERLLRGGALAHIEQEDVRKDGSRIQVSLTLSPIKDATGFVTGVSVIAHDITERKRAEVELSESEAGLAAAQRIAHIGSWQWDVQTDTARWSDETFRIFGLTPRQLKDHRRVFLESIHPEDRTRVDRALTDALSGARDYDLDYRVRLADGTEKVVHSHAEVLKDEAGKPLGMRGIVHDITESKRAEEEHVRLVTAIEHSAEAVVITNTLATIEYVNPAFTRITGYSREEALGQNPRILKSDKQDPAFYQQLWETILKGETWHGELINRRKDGSLYTEQMNIAPVRGALGEVTHFIATKQDVTERKVLEGQLRQATKMEAVGRLAGGIAHDFNNLLTIINGYTELLIDRFAADNRVTVYLKEIAQAGERAATLTRQLLAFSRSQVLAPQVLDLNAVVSNLEKMLKRMIGEDIELDTLLAPSLGRVKADPGQIEQVIMNIVVNARDAMPRGGHLTIETSNVELDETYARNHVTVKPGPHVMLAIADDGVGMTPETQAHIFEPFFTTKEQGKGTGLGLATVYGIVKQSGGSIWAYSEVGQGSVFKIYLPMVDESPAAEPGMMESGSSAGTETILVVEDEVGVRSLINLALVSSGYTVLDTTDAESALEICAKYEGPIHLLLTDVVMPQMSGPMVAERVAALRPDIKVLYMSGYTDDSVVRHGVLTQEMPFIQKPFSPIALRNKIREVLGGK
jgi:PAS domain S-box-containing protein